MAEYALLTGNEAIANGVKVCRPDIIAVYPITPQTQIPEELANFSAQFRKTGEGLNAEVVYVESEHSAMAVCYGAALTGGRAFTATSSHGLLYMYEMLYWSAGARLPIVLANVMRAVGSPWNIWPDHNDAMMLRDFPAIQLFAGNCQEAHDFVPIAYRLAEETSFLTVINTEGFILSHSGEPVELMEQEKVNLFLPGFKPPYRIDITNPRSFGASSDTPDFFYELRKRAYAELDSVKDKFSLAAKEFGKIFGRNYDVIEKYLTEDADLIIVTIGTAFDTAKIVIDDLRKKGERIGAIKVRLFRPFPARELREALDVKFIQKIVVVESNNTAVLTNGIRSMLYSAPLRNPYFAPPFPPTLRGYIAGIGGKEIGPEVIEKIIRKAKLSNLEEIEWEGGNGK